MYIGVMQGISFYIRPEQAYVCHSTPVDQYLFVNIVFIVIFLDFFFSLCDIWSQKCNFPQVFYFAVIHISDGRYLDMDSALDPSPTTFLHSPVILKRIT